MSPITDPLLIPNPSRISVTIVIRDYICLYIRYFKKLYIHELLVIY